MPKTPAEMIEAVKRNLTKNTGRSYDEWQAIASQGPREEKALYAWLRATHALGHVAAKILSGGMQAYDAPDRLVDAQYAGKQAALRPIYEAVVKAARKLGRDVAAKPCKTYVPLHRHKTFAIVKPGAGRVEVGLCLDGARAGGRLQAAKHLGSDRVTHKVVLTSAKEVDGELARWLRQAYDRAT